MAKKSFVLPVSALLLSQHSSAQGEILSPAIPPCEGRESGVYLQSQGTDREICYSLIIPRIL